MREAMHLRAGDRVELVEIL
ncbi:hypothetical protein [Rhodanobacter thiooxydans]|nr:hypothetical protein [Rhodanobacter thiooxydans]